MHRILLYNKVFPDFRKIIRIRNFNKYTVVLFCGLKCAVYFLFHPVLVRRRRRKRSTTAKL